MRARWPHIALAAALGLVAGLFLARLLAEQWPASCIALYEPAGAAALALLTALAVVAVWLVASRITGDPPDAVPLLPLALLGVYAVQPGVNLAQAWTLLVGSLLMGLLLYTTQHARAGRLVFAGVTLLTFLLYLRTLAPGVIVGDAAEFQTILPTLGIAHPTGYPLYTLLGWLWTRMPFGEVAWRVNLLSAVCGALTVGVVYLVADRWSSPPFSTPTPPLPLKLGGRGGVRKARGGVGGSQVVAALTALAFAATPTWWDQCVMAEIYALGTLLAVTALYAVLRWGDDPARRVRWLWLAAGCMGLGLAHHRTIILVAPALLAYILLTDWRIVRRPRDWLPALPLVLLPLALYAYFPLRWPALHDGQPMTGDQFRFLVLAEGYAPALRLDAAVGTVAPDRWAIYLRLVGEQFGPAAWLALPGVLWLLARRPRLGIVTGLWYAATVLFGLAYFVPDVSVFFIPAHLVLALWIGCTLWLAVRALARWPRLQVAGLTVAALLPLALVWTNLPAADLSGETAAQDWGEMALSYPIRENAVIICDVHRLAPLNYLAHGAGRRPDLTLTMPDTEAQSREIIAQALAAGRPVYLARFVPGLEGIYALRSVGPLVEVSPDPLATPPSIEHPTDAVFGGTVRLLSYDGPGFEMRNSELGTRYTLYWQATGPIGQNLHPRLRLVDAAGRTWAEEAGRPPVDGLYPTTAWPVDAVVPDYHELVIPPDTPPGEYQVQVRLTAPFADEGLRLQGEVADGSDAVTLQAITVPPLAGFTRQPEHVTRARFGDRLLVGYDQAQGARPGGRVPLTLYWQALGPASDTRVRLQWRPAAGSDPWTATSSLGASGQFQQETFVVTVPLAAAGPGQLWLALDDAAGRPVPAQPGWLAPADTWCPLGPLDIAGTPLTGLANFDDRVLLLDAAVSPASIAPGDEVQVTLRWQCVGRMTADYTVFVHLLDTGEHVQGQVDAQPIYGTRPTSTWREGEVVADDVYTFRVKADAPPGTCRIEVGLYDAATMTRLPVLGEDLAPIGDRVFLPPTVEVR